MNSRILNSQWLTRVIVLGIFLALAILAGVTVLTHLAYQRAESDLLVEDDLHVTFLSAFRLQAELSTFSQTLQNLARTKEIQSQNLSSQRQALKQAAYRLADFDGGVILFDNFGRVIASEPERADLIGQDWSERDYFRRLLSGSTTVFSNIASDGPNMTPVVVVSVPILNDSGQFTGALGGMFRLGQKTVSAFYASIVRLRLGQNGNTYVLDGNGRILFDSTSNLVAQPYSNRVSGIVLGKSPGAQRFFDADHREIMAFYSTIPGTPWTLITEEVWELIIAPVQKYVDRLLVLVILGILISSVGLGALLYLRDRAFKRHSHIENELQLAHQMKRKLLPSQVPFLPGWKLSVYHHPSSQVSGDFYDFMFLPDGRLLLAIIEDAERGIAAISKITTLRTAIHGAGQRLLTPAEALDCCNTLICPEMLPGYSIQCLYGIFNPSSGCLDFASAGQGLAYLANGATASELRTTGAPLGLSLQSSYQQDQAVIRPGERILLCNHGAISVRNPKGEPFGGQRLVANLRLNYQDDVAVIDRLVAELRNFSGRKWEPEDDVTIMLLERSSES